MAMGCTKIVSSTFQQFHFTGGFAPELARKRVALITQVKNVLQGIVVLLELVSGGMILESQTIVEELCL